MSSSSSEPTTKNQAAEQAAAADGRVGNNNMKREEPASDQDAIISIVGSIFVCDVQNANLLSLFLLFVASGVTWEFVRH